MARISGCWCASLSYVLFWTDRLDGARFLATSSHFFLQGTIAQGTSMSEM